jgi:16S rRNA (uracil1498-N3)-methyltransferase
MMADLRFFLNHIDPSSGKVVFPPDIAHQIVHVLRLQPGDQVTVLDGEGRAYQVCLNPFDESLSAEILRIGESPVRVPLQMALFFPLSKRDRVEWILQKCTEVGVAAFHPFISERSLVQEIELPPKKAARWESIIREAAEQSGRAVLPVLHHPQRLSEIVTAGLSAYALDTALVALVGQGVQPLAIRLNEILKNDSDPSLGLFIGTEGGFSEQELAQFKAASFSLVSLGDTVLRMETAAIVFPALVLYGYSNRRLSE